MVAELQLLLELPEVAHEELLDVLVPVLAFMQEKITTSAEVLPVLVPVPPVPGSDEEGKSKAMTLLLNKMNKAILLEKYIFVFIFYLRKIVKSKKHYS